MATFSIPPCPDNWVRCDFCGAPPGGLCMNPDYAEQETNMKAKAKDTNPKSAAARAKASLSLVPSVAIFEMAQAFRDGAAKYGPYNWRKDPVSASVYLDAAFRHIELYRVGQEVATDSGIKHLVHAMSCFAILLDAELCGTLIDDRDKMDDPALLEEFLEACRVQNEG